MMDIAVQPAAPNQPASAPEWATVQRDILCPLCKYNLRGLVEPRCPECGYRFDWEELLHPEKLLQEYLFESRPEHNGRAFFHTLWRSLRPKTFWSTISPGQRPNARRLVLYWVFACVPLALGFGLNFAWQGEASDLVGAFHRLVVRTIISSGWYGGLDLAQGIMLLLVALFAWPWLTLLALSVFIESMFRTKIDGVHVLRCVTYTAGVTFPIGVAAAVVGALLVVYDPTSLRMNFPKMIAFNAIAVVLWAWLTQRLIVAYRLYLRFDHPAATVLASQAIALLGMFTIAMWAAFFGR